MFVLSLKWNVPSLQCRGDIGFNRYILSLKTNYFLLCLLLRRVFCFWFKIDSSTCKDLRVLIRDWRVRSTLSPLTEPAGPFGDVGMLVLGVHSCHWVRRQSRAWLSLEIANVKLGSSWKLNAKSKSVWNSYRKVVSLLLCTGLVWLLNAMYKSISRPKK